MDTITVAPLADAMTAADIYAHAERLRKMIGRNAEIYPAISGIKATIVTFRPSPDMANAVMRGDVDAAFEFYAAE